MGAGFTRFSNARVFPQHRLPADGGGNCTYKGRKTQERRRLGETSLQPPCGRRGAAHLDGKPLGRPRKPSSAWRQLLICSLFTEHVPVSILVAFLALAPSTVRTTLGEGSFITPVLQVRKPIRRPPELQSQDLNLGTQAPETML